MEKVNNFAGGGGFQVDVDVAMKHEIINDSATISYVASAGYDHKTPLERAQEEITKKRNELTKKKTAELAKIYIERLNGYLGTYFNGWSEIEEENTISYETLNKSWREYAVKANRTQKYLVLSINAFEVEVARIVSENPQFQKQVINLTDL